MSVENSIIKEFDRVLEHIRMAEQDIIALDYEDKMKFVNELVEIENHIKNIKSGVVIPTLEITKDTEIASLRDDGLMSTMSCNTLLRDGCKTIGDVLNYTRQELSVVRHMGKKSMDEIIEFLTSNGFTLKGDLNTNTEE